MVRAALNSMLSGMTAAERRNAGLPDRVADTGSIDAGTGELLLTVVNSSSQAARKFRSALIAKKREKYVERLPDGSEKVKSSATGDIVRLQHYND